MRQYATVGPAVCVLVVVTGCVSQRADVRQRIDQTIRDLKTYDPGSPESQETLAALGKATPHSLRTPHLVFARFYVVPDRGKAVLVVIWLEATPTPDAVLIRNRATAYEKKIPFAAVYFEENAATSKVHVRFWATELYQMDTREWQELYAQISNHEAEAVLTKNDKPVSNVVPVATVLRGSRPTSG